jgi:predicted branched-subunit amino acid permease
MRTVWRTVDPRLARDVGALALAVGFVGLSFGAIATAAGVPLWAVMAMSLFVFAGGSQFMAVGLVGNPAAAIFAGLLLNARHLPFGLAVGDVLRPAPVPVGAGAPPPAPDREAAPAPGPGSAARPGPGGRPKPGGRLRLLVGSHFLLDESTAFALAQPDPARRRQAYWLTGVVLFVAWNLASPAGALLGGAVGDPDTLGLDAAFPAALFALLLPTLRKPGRQDRAAPWVAVVGAVIAVATTPLVPAGLPVLLALAALGLALVVPVRKREPVPC